MRLGWLIWPWMGMAPKPRFLATSASFLVWSQVLVNTIIVDELSSLKR